MKTAYLFFGLMLLQSCSAQEQKQDTLTKELEFINVFLPENIKTISYEAFHNNLMKNGIEKIEYQRTTDECDYYEKYIKNNSVFKLNVCYNKTKDSIQSFSLSVNFDIDSIMRHLGNPEKDTLSEYELEYIDRMNNMVVSNEKKVGNLIKSRLKNLFPILNQEPYKRDIHQVNGVEVETFSQWFITSKKGKLKMEDIYYKSSIIITESLVDFGDDKYIVKNGQLISKYISFIEGSFSFIFEK